MLYAKWTYTTRPVFTLLWTSGIMGSPLEDRTGDIERAHKMLAMSMNSELFATCRPMQILPK